MDVKVLSHGGMAIIELDDGRECAMSVGFHETAPDGKPYIAVFALSFRWYECISRATDDPDLIDKVATFLAQRIRGQGGDKDVRIVNRSG